eukprot:COSAG01_NODE_21243_length_911_cov_1.333744_1_plen_76_part_01
MGSQKCGTLWKSQSVLIMINLIIFTRTVPASVSGLDPRTAPQTPPFLAGALHPREPRRRVRLAHEQAAVVAQLSEL